jgi:hypothetical protein
MCTYELLLSTLVSYDLDLAIVYSTFFYCFHLPVVDNLTTGRKRYITLKDKDRSHHETMANRLGNSLEIITQVEEGL